MVPYLHTDASSVVRLIAPMVTIEHRGTAPAGHGEPMSQSQSLCTHAEWFIGPCITDFDTAVPNIDVK